MHLKRSLVACFLLVAFGAGAVMAQTDYPTHLDLTKRLRDLESRHKSLVKVSSLTKTGANNDVWLLTIGSGDVQLKPAVAVVAGVDGAHIMGTELALRFAESLLARAAEPGMKSVLEQSTFYVFPNVNPDATAQYHAKLRYERSGNSTPTDDDRDGRLNEDPFEDLNNDGLISLMRVADPTGAWRMHEADARVMVKADPSKGEKGGWHVFSEGIDNDKDGQFNEDAEGGVNLNRNFTYQYPAFTAGAGEYAVSEKENRALLDFLFDAWNVYAVVTFSPGNNLSNPWKFNRAAVSRRIITGPYENDAKVNEYVSGLYNKLVPKDNAPASEMQPGGFMEWAYFHYARFSFGTPGWWTPKAKDPADSLKPKDWKQNKDNNADVNHLRWAESQKLDKTFVNWSKVPHPDFPGKTVEVGGFVPFVRTNAPYSMVESIAQKHTDFLVQVAEHRPQIVLQNKKADQVEAGLARISFDIHNAGGLPTSTQIGPRTKWVRPVNITVKLDKNQSLVSGKLKDQIMILDADATEARSWLIQGKGTVSITVGTPMAGFDTFTYTIK